MEYGLLKILFVSAECSPFANIGGLGEVIGSLPYYLKDLGHEVRIVIPRYSFIDPNDNDLRILINNMAVEAGNENISCTVYMGLLKSKVEIYFIDYEPFFGRSGIYHDNYFNDYYDNLKRFTFLSKAALQLCKELNLSPDIVHANDWHTAILPAFLQRFYNNDPVLGNTASVLTIHNLAYQGCYDRYFYGFTGLGDEDFVPDRFEYYNKVNLLKGGIYFADKINTVSQSYASETKTSSGGFELDYHLRMRGDDYTGILNGVDYEVWDPVKDPLIPENYGPQNLTGKAECKKVLQKRFELNESDEIPLIGIISRLTEQKGLDVLSGCIENILNDMQVQFVILGTGEHQLENFYSGLSQRYSGVAGTYIGYNRELSHLIEAGSDFLLMPSLFEPCGLTQIYALKYGTIPIVRATGGLNDTVENYNRETGEGTGFKFTEPSQDAIYYTVCLAHDTYFNRKLHMQNLIKKAMSQNYSWEVTAGEYVKLYHKALDNMQERKGRKHL